MLVYDNTAREEGYWSYTHMILQLEDILNILCTVFGAKSDYLFPFDHSCGHDKMRLDALNISSMWVSYGGVAKSMHDSIIEEYDGLILF